MGSRWLGVWGKGASGTFLGEKPFGAEIKTEVLSCKRKKLGRLKLDEVECQIPRSYKVTRIPCIYGRHRRECTKEVESSPSAVRSVAG